ncbi:sugar ABC transporter permease [Pseudarthrobacter sp. R1]|uniref:carbohydrate ABC transporter permease n=1 Tax=Pseudarthrobacter sp. R1 TaxID=2944934 RepID=UPI00210EE9E4|nr:sugar ABC transporter permease [Pseudarthrobacter sp. R1]MCQ6273354.1 sugar ABC transporter permease [Pseudarthrobacter sp. R1]
MPPQERRATPPENSRGKLPFLRRFSRNSSVAWAWALLAPSIVLVVAVIAYPLLTGISLSLHTVVMTRPDLGRPFVWFENFARMAQDPVILTAAWNTAIYVVVGVVSQFIVGLIAAVVLNRRSKNIWIARTIVMLPWFLPPIAAAYMFAFMIDPRYGVLTKMLSLVGIDISGQGVLADPNLALWGALLVELWRSYPFFALFLLAALQGIPEELSEAAALDGATRFGYFRHVVWPLLKPVVIASTLLEGIRLANSPTMLLLLTNGGPGDSTQVLSLYAFQQAYQRFDFGYASAIAVALLVVVIGFTSVYVRVNSTKER